MESMREGVRKQGAVTTRRGRMSGSDSDGGFDYSVRIPARQGPRVASQLGKPLVTGPGDLPFLPDALKGREFGFALTFEPRLIEAVCDSGYFPMSLDVGLPVFAVKVHTKRCAMLLQVCAPAAVC